MQNQIVTTIQAVDPVYVFIFTACLVMLLGIAGAMIYFVARFHRSRSPEPISRSEGNWRLELIWTLLPTLLVLAMFYYGWAGYLTLREVPADAMPVTAIARMWSWSFKYANGKTSPKLYVPVGKPVKVSLESRDVLHGFYLPAFRVKRDVVPGMRNRVWFVATKPGTYDIFCSQFCGTGHSAMVTTVEAVPEPQFQAWLKEEVEVEQHEEGQGEHHGEHEPKGAHRHEDGSVIAKEKGCLGCHSLDGSRGVGPTFKGLFGSKVSINRQGKGTVVVADDAYLSESITAPKAAVVEGFQPVMPEYDDLSKAQVAALVAFIKTLH